MESDEADQQVLDAVGQVLRPGGRFLLETRNREQVMRTWHPRVWQPLADGSLFLQEATLDLLAGRIHTQVILVEPDGRREERAFLMRLYTLAELGQMLGAAGLTVRETWGGFDGSRYTLDSPRLLLLAKQPVAAESH